MMTNNIPITTFPLLEYSQASTSSFEEVAADLPIPTVSISPKVADQLTSGCIAISAIWAVSGLLKQFRLLIEALDREER